MKKNGILHNETVLVRYFFYHDVPEIALISEKYSMATKSKAAKISAPRVFQIYVRDDLLELGAQTQSVDGYEFRIYDRERMLIELLRNKNTMWAGQFS